MTKTACTLSLALLLAAAPVAGQYTRPGELGEERLTAREALRRAAQSARWQLGPLQLEPRLEVSNVGYVSNIYFSSEAEAISDVRAKATAGLRAFFNLGPKVLVSPFADLTYSWWQDQAALRTTNDSFGVQLLGDFNRLQMQLRADRIGLQRNLSSELEVPVDSRTDGLELDVEVDFWGPFAMFGGARTNRQRYSGRPAEERIAGLDLTSLDADIELLRGGLVYELGNGLRLGAGVERSETTFRNDPGGRSNRGSGPLLTLGFEGSRLGFDLDAARRDLDFAGRGGGDRRRQTVGRGQLRLKLTEKSSAALYGGIQLRAAAIDRQGLFESRRSGISLQQRPGPRTRFGVFYEVGEDEFASVASDEVGRVDDFRSYGVDLEYRLSSRFSVQLGYLDSRRESSDAAFDTDLRSFTSRLRLGTDLLP